MSEYENKTELPDRPDLRNEMSIIPVLFMAFLILASLAGTIYYYFVVKDTEMGKNLLVVTGVVTLFSFFYYIIIKKIVYNKKM
jgi:hypothetical protein